jgi:hypothetical protein
VSNIKYPAACIDVAPRTLAVSHEAGFEALSLVTALGPLPHRVGEAGQLSGCNRAGLSMLQHPGGADGKMEDTF